MFRGIEKLLFFASAMLAFSTPTYACATETKTEISLKKPESDRKECISLYLEFPDKVGILDKPTVFLRHADGSDRFLEVILQVNDYEKNDGKLTTSFCLAEEILRHSSISISWDHINEHGFSQSAWCNTFTDTGNLFELMEAGSKYVAPSDI